MNLKLKTFLFGFIHVCGTAMLYATPVIVFVMCIDKGSEIGNPVSPGDPEPDVQIFHSMEELNYIIALPGPLTVEQMRSLRVTDSAIIDSMMVKAFNNYYWGKK